MNAKLQDTILSFTQSTPRTIAEIADYLYTDHAQIFTYEETRKCLQKMILSGSLKHAEKRRVGMARQNQYLATTMDERIALEDSKQKVTTPSPAFSNDPIMKAFYSKVNI
jgi:phage tail tube protein FII